MKRLFRLLHGVLQRDILRGTSTAGIPQDSLPMTGPIRIRHQSTAPSTVVFPVVQFPITLHFPRTKKNSNKKNSFPKKGLTHCQTSAKCHVDPSSLSISYQRFSGQKYDRVVVLMLSNDRITWHFPCAGEANERRVSKKINQSIKQSSEGSINHT
jgi:hypothetical protein